MPKYNLVIADSDSKYCAEMSNYFLKYESQRFKVRTITQAELLQSFVAEQDSDTDILLICQEFYLMAQNFSNAQVIILLSESSIKQELAELKSVNKYQPVDKLANQIVNILLDANPSKHYMTNKSDEAKIIGVYSPIPRIGKTMTAIAGSKLVSHSGESVLYLSLADFSSTGKYFSSDENQSMSELLYFVKGRNKNLSAKIEAIRCLDHQSGVAFFLPPNSINDYDQTTFADWEFLISQLKQNSIFDHVFVDFSSRFDSHYREILNLCDKIILLVSTNEEDLENLQIMYKNIKILGLDKLAEKFVPVFNQSSLDKSFGNDGFEGHVLPYFSEASTWMSESKEVLFKSPFGVSLMTLLGKMES